MQNKSSLLLKDFCTQI